MIVALVLLSITTLVFLCLCSYFKWQLLRRESSLKTSHEAEKLLRHDLTQLERQCRLALEDHVTGLPTWPVFEDKLSRVMEESGRLQMAAGLLLVEISDFSLLTGGMDTKSSYVLLKEVADRIRQVLRKVDIASRYKNATFAVMATQLSKPEIAAMVAQRILQTLAEPFNIGERTVYIDASIGIAVYPTDGADVGVLLQAAQAAVRVANESGNHKYHFYQEKNQIASQRELSLHVNVKRDDIFQELELYYQPVIDVKSNAILYMDASIVWHHSEFGLIDSQELNYYIEKQRRENLFSEWQLKTACEQFMGWREKGFCPALLGIPISVRQLETTSFIYHLTQITQACGFKPEWLLLELRDTNSALSFDILEKAFNMLNYLGVKLAISHSGVTTFSFSCLRYINVQYIVLKKGFIDDVESNTRTQAMLRGMKLLADSLSCELVVCGVESPSQMTLLEELGCHLMQGCMLGEPVHNRDVMVKMAPQV